MSVYLIPIQRAIVIFPFLAGLCTIPYAIHQYRKFGSIMMLRVTIIYSFIFYILCAYFMTILPLPPIEEVAQYTNPTTQLIPFQFIDDLQAVWDGSFMQLLRQPAFFQIAFNGLLLFPLGVYLRYYFQFPIAKVLLFSFLMSLSFECIQLSGLFGIYPRPYRLFDVDDLIINTAGGVLGCLCAPLFGYFLPSRAALDQSSYQRGQRVSGGRRALALICDWLLLAGGSGLFYAILLMYVPGASLWELPAIFCMVFFLLDVLLPLLTHGQTLGKALVKIRLVQKEDQPVRLPALLYHYVIRDMTFFAAPLWFTLIIQGILTNSTAPYVGLCIGLFLYMIYLVILGIQSIAALIQEQNVPLYNKVWGIHNDSLIQCPSQEADQNSDLPEPTTEIAEEKEPSDQE